MVASNVGFGESLDHGLVSAQRTLTRANGCVVEHTVLAELNTLTHTRNTTVIRRGRWGSFLQCSACAQFRSASS